jgi:hypothetical protein
MTNRPNSPREYIALIDTMHTPAEVEQVAFAVTHRMYLPILCKALFERVVRLLAIPKTTSPEAADLAGQIRTVPDADTWATLQRDVLSSVPHYRTLSALCERVSELLPATATSSPSPSTAPTGTYLMHDGIRYDLSEWLTVNAYAAQQGVTPQAVQNQLRRGVIPTDRIVDVAHLNDLRLIQHQ